MSSDLVEYTLVKPKELRRRFTEFVYRNHVLALNDKTMSLPQSEGFFASDSQKMSINNQSISNNNP